MYPSKEMIPYLVHTQMSRCLHVSDLHGYAYVFQIWGRGSLEATKRALTNYTLGRNMDMFLESHPVANC